MKGRAASALASAYTHARLAKPDMPKLITAAFLPR